MPIIKSDTLSDGSACLHVSVRSSPNDKIRTFGDRLCKKTICVRATAIFLSTYVFNKMLVLLLIRNKDTYILMTWLYLHKAFATNYIAHYPSLQSLPNVPSI